jgi:hypothetical protein
LEILTSAEVFRGLVQGLAAGQSAGWDLKPGGAFGTEVDLLVQDSSPLSPGLPPTPEPQVQEVDEGENELVLPEPQLAGVLPALPPLDLSALEHGLHQFLDQLGEVGRGLVGDPDGAGLYLWVAAGAAAATACTIARRQLKQPPGGPDGEGKRMPGVPAGPIFAG